MLRGRCSYSNSDSPTTSPASQSPLSPIISEVTQKQGVGGTFELLTGHPTKNAHPERAARAKRSPHLSPRTPPIPALPQLLLSPLPFMPRSPNQQSSSRLQLCYSCTLTLLCRTFPYFPYTLSPISFFFCRFPDSYRKNGGRGDPSPVSPFGKGVLRGLL